VPMVTIDEQRAVRSRPAPRPIPTPRSTPIFGRDAASRIQAMTEKYQLRGDPSLGVALVAIYFSHQELWHPHAQGARASTRSAAKFHFAVKKLMSVISQDVTTLAELLSAPAVAESLASAMVGKFAGNHRAPAGSAPTMGDLSTLMVLLRRLLLNSTVAKKAKSARGRGKDPLAVTVSAELGQLYDKCCPSSSRRMLRGESRSNIRARFVHEAAGMLGVRLTEYSSLTYRKKKHLRRVRS
jgi:hypothetical protein